MHLILIKAPPGGHHGGILKLLHRPGGSQIRFYTEQHHHYCGIDLHSRFMYLCILDQSGDVLVHRNMKACPENFLRTVELFRDNLVVAVECIFTWYWLADLCARENISFVLGHALYMKVIHGGKAKNDKIDSHKIASLLRRRVHLMRKRSELLAHIQNTNSQYNLEPFAAILARKVNREGSSSASPTTA